MSLRNLVLIFLAVFAFATTASAAGKRSEFAVYANYIDVQGSQSASILNVSLGQFLTPQVVLATSLNSVRNFGYTGTTIALGGKFFFMDGFRGDLVPFAGAGIGLRQSATPTDSNHASTEYELNLGVSFFMSDSTTLDGKLKFLNFNDSSPSITMFVVGFTQRF